MSHPSDYMPNSDEGYREVPFLRDSLRPAHFGLDDPDVDIRPGEVPYSLRFQDSYHSKHTSQDGRGGPLQESRAVFLEGSGLPLRWHGRSEFVVAELGFGAGRNFLATWNLWRASRTEGQRLHYIGIEGFPAPIETQRGMLVQLQEVAHLSDELLIQRVPRIASVQRIVLDGGSLILTLAFGEAGRILPELIFSADSWYLDGFAPKLNPAIWSEEVLREAVRHSNAGCTFATYSAASAVRRALSDSGVNIELRPGFGGKKEMILGSLPAEEPRAVVGSPPRHPIPNGSSSFDVAVLGAGIAGCAAAAILEGRGARTILLEQQDRIAAEASGNRAAIVMPQLSVKPDLRSRFYLTAYYRLLRELDSHAAERGSSLLQSNGVLQLLTSNRLERLANELDGLRLPSQTIALLDQKDAEQRAGVTLTGPALFYAEGGVLNPAELCASLISRARNLELRLGLGGCTFVRADGRWEVRDSRGMLQAAADNLVIAAGAYAPQLTEALNIPMRWNRGQVISLRPTTASQNLRCAVCYDGYVTPAIGGEHLAGATYEHDNRSTEFDTSCVRDLLSRLESAAPSLGLTAESCSDGRAALRATTRDRLPLAGPIADSALFREQFAAGGLRACPSGAMIPGLFISSGHGSRGVVSALLAAEILAHHILREPAPVERDLLDAVHPARFLARELRKE